MFAAAAIRERKYSPCATGILQIFGQSAK